MTDVPIGDGAGEPPIGQRPEMPVAVVVVMVSPHSAGVSVSHPIGQLQSGSAQSIETSWSLSTPSVQKFASAHAASARQAASAQSMVPFASPSMPSTHESSSAQTAAQSLSMQSVAASPSLSKLS